MVTDREPLKLIVEKAFDQHVIERLGLNTLFGSFGWELLLHISRNYYSELVREFYANIFHKIDKDLSTIISTVKGVRMVLDKSCLASILGIRDDGNIVTVDSNRKSINGDPVGTTR